MNGAQLRRECACATPPATPRPLAEAVAAQTDAEGEVATAEPVQPRRSSGDLGRPAAGKGRVHGPSRPVAAARAGELQSPDP
jgi:hypothetical protein